MGPPRQRHGVTNTVEKKCVLTTHVIVHTDPGLLAVAEVNVCRRSGMHGCIYELHG